MKKILLIIIIVFAGLSLSGQTGVGWAQQKAKVNFKDTINIANGLKIGGTTQTPANWNTAYTDRLKWDGGDASLVAGTGRTSLGGSTVGQAYFTLTNPSAITFPRMNADNTVTALSAANFATAIGAGHVYSDSMKVSAGILRTKVTTITTFPYSVQIFSSAGKDITDAVSDSIGLSGGFYNLYVYSVDALSAASIKIIY